MLNKEGSIKKVKKVKKGENPYNVKLNLVIDGKGTAWIDDVRLLRASLG